MKRWLWLAFVGLFLAAPWASTSPSQATKPVQDKTLPAYGVQVFLIPCNGGGERTGVIVATTSHEPAVLGLYAYDPHGNCIARDEFDDTVAKDRAAFDAAYVEWFPPAKDTYTIEVRNVSPTPCAIQLAFR